ncbi:hypothetical protein SUGI_0954620 [Cryptomeria japonica]|nr:hypothetical protein SUGI_0954620 [Cryptomeria japonica]
MKSDSEIAAMAAGIAGRTVPCLQLKNAPAPLPHFGRGTLFQSQLGFKKNRYQIKRSSSGQVVARLFGPAIFEASKLKVLFLGTHEENHPAQLPRTYTLTHSDITSKITVAISQTINKDQLQGWYNRLQRDEVLAQWKMSQGKMSLHVHCHISGGHWLLDAIAKLRFYIFRKELPVVLEAFRHGDKALFEKHPELEDALVWVYFHSNVKQFKRLECWGSLAQASKGAPHVVEKIVEEENTEEWEMPRHCPHPCECCFPPFSLLLWPQDPKQFMEEN